MAFPREIRSKNKSVYENAVANKEGTLFKCQIYQALREYANWGHCKLKLTQSKSYEMKIFEEGRKPEYPRKNLSEQSRESTNLTHIWHRVWESNPGHIESVCLSILWKLARASLNSMRWISFESFYESLVSDLFRLSSDFLPRMSAIASVRIRVSLGKWSSSV